MSRDEKLAAVCGRTNPRGKGKKTKTKCNKRNILVLSINIEAIYADIHE